MKRDNKPSWATPDVEKDNAALREHYEQAIAATGNPDDERGLDLKPIAKLVAVLKGKRKS